MWRRAAVIVALTSAAAGATVAQAAPAAPYIAPPFARQCLVHHFAEGQIPNLNAYPDDPLCVDYAKRDITVDNGGALRFARAEPSRFAIALRKCRYWQVDHWSIQVDRAYGAVVRWDGSYWWDKAHGTGAALLRNFTIAGQPVGAYQAAAAVATVNPGLAAQIRRYGAGPGGGGGMSFAIGRGRC